MEKLWSALAHVDRSSGSLGSAVNKTVHVLIDTAPYLSWHYWRFGVQALGAMGGTDAAIGYAQDSLGLNDSPAAIAHACEEILRETGRSDEAFERFALEANRAGTHLATCRAIMKKYFWTELRQLFVLFSIRFVPGWWTGLRSGPGAAIDDGRGAGSQVAGG